MSILKAMHDKVNAMKRGERETRIITAARVLAAAEGKADWRPFVKAAKLVAAALKGGRAETLVEVFPGYKPLRPRG